MYKLKFFSRVVEAPQKTPKRVTTVALFKGDSTKWGDEIETATVVRHFRDPDVPVLGQKFAIEKLIKDGKFSKEERTEIWEAFWSYSPKAESIRRGGYREEIRRIKWNGNLLRWL